MKKYHAIDSEDFYDTDTGFVSPNVSKRQHITDRGRYDVWFWIVIGLLFAGIVGWFFKH